MLHLRRLRRLRPSASCSLCTSQPRKDLNQFGVDLLPRQLQQLLFKSVQPRPPPSEGRRAAAIQELHKFGLTPETGETVPLPDVQPYLPPLLGDSVSQHFRSSASQQTSPYTSPLYSLLAAPAPPMPEVWVSQEGWTRY